MSQAELGRLAFQALLHDVQRETPNPKGTEYVLKTSFVLRDSTAMNPGKRSYMSFLKGLDCGFMVTAGRASTFWPARHRSAGKAQARGAFRADRMDTVLYGVAYYRNTCHMNG